MRFGPRNAFYLRISESTVLPLYLYLDERHIDWMSERVLQHVLQDLRPRILPKLQEEADAHLGSGGPANAKRGTIDVHRGDTYQFGYFLRKIDQHAVLIKTRHFISAPDPPPGSASPRPVSPDSPVPKGRKRASRRSAVPPKQTKKRKTKGKQKAQESDEEGAVLSISSDDEDQDTRAASVVPALRRSARKRTLAASGYRETDDGNTEPLQIVDVDADADVEMSVPSQDATVSQQSEDVTLHDQSELLAMDQSEDAPAPVKHEDTEPALSEMPAPPLPSTGRPTIQSRLEEGEDDDKRKLVLQLKYQGFDIQGRCLCVIVEPYPPVRYSSKAPSRAPSAAPMGPPRAPSIAPPNFVPSGTATQRAGTPLFLPEYDRDRSTTPAPLQQAMPPAPFYSMQTVGNSDSDDEDGGMMQFSQIIRQHQPSAAEDDDEIDGAVFFGDADETKEL